VFPLLALLLSPPILAAEIVATVAADGGPVVVAPAAEPISLDLEEAEIRSVLRLFAEHAGLNFVLDDDVQGTVTVHLESVPWDQALAAILMAEGLVAVPMAPEGQPAAVYVVQPLAAQGG